MEVKYAFFCDAATVDSAGKLNVLGIFTNINMVKFPGRYHQMYFVAALEGHRSEIGKHKFKINFVDEDGKEIIKPLEGKLEINEKKT